MKYTFIACITVGILLIYSIVYAIPFRYVGTHNTSDCTTSTEATFKVNSFPTLGSGQGQCGFYCHVLLWTGMIPSISLPDYSEAGIGLEGRFHNNNTRAQLFWTNKRKGGAQYMKGKYVPNGNEVRIRSTKVLGRNVVLQEWWWIDAAGVSRYAHKNVPVGSWSGSELGVHPAWAPEIAAPNTSNFPQNVDVEAHDVTIYPCDTSVVLEQDAPYAAQSGYTVTDWRVIYP